MQNESNETRIERLLSDGRDRRNWVLLLQARAALLEEADATVKGAAAAGRGFTEDEQRQVSSYLRRAADIEREVSDIRAAFEKNAQNAHPVSRAI